MRNQIIQFWQIKLFGLAVFSALALSACGQATPPLRDVINNPELLGLQDSGGRWYLRPNYKEVVYVQAIDAYWVKPAVKEAFRLGSFGKNGDWMLVDKEGKELPSSLPDGVVPLREWPPKQALGVSGYFNALPVLSKDGAGLADPHGKLLTECKYHSLNYAGDGYWIGLSMQRDSASPKAQLKAVGNLGNPYALPPPAVLLDKDGKVVKELDNSIAMAHGHFVDGLLMCNSYGKGMMTIDRSGNIISAAGTKFTPPGSSGYSLDRSEHSYNKFYSLPISEAKPVELKDCSKMTGLPSEIIPVEISAGRLLVHDQNNLYGLIDTKGNWITAPKYNRLASYFNNMNVCSEGPVTDAQMKARKEEIQAPDIR